MATDSQNAAAAGSKEGSSPPALTRLERPTGPRFEQFLPWLALLAVIGLAWWGRDYWMPDAWRYPRRETAPAGLSWLPFEATRQQVLERLARNGAEMKCIEPPRMGPMLWASHTNVTLEGMPVKEFALIYSDGGQYNYRALRERPVRSMRPPSPRPVPTRPASWRSAGSPPAVLSKRIRRRFPLWC